MLLGITLLFSLLVFTGCPTIESTNNSSSEPAGGEPAEGAFSSSADDAEPESPQEVPAPTESADKVDSVYTDLAADKCETIEEENEGYYSKQKCQGAFGYSLEVIESDIRQTINVVDPSGKVHELKMMRVVSPAFSYVGNKAEWRFREEDGKKTPIALIVRFNASVDPNSDEEASYLTVSKITESEICITDVVKPIKDANVKAREFASKAADKPCLEGRQ
ncbi:MAG: hypothetical protein DWQ47_17395 [Acidobacteria bacterium]|nr:MAG: hypothetical protein DWQ32_04795 [Acidobacteriota bacterium]REK02185.1 MAG: hypothetical protein DWQ38_07360 [Acidobacteriota bacterium]REK14013.1 MAG: hypothetical protein DWQ43_10485 [Acidobacteriota bacterium]REK42008.1 MAG: hypothetical protein DWQ47_17395 [Acidobacteriota bacterium]